MANWCTRCTQPPRAGVPSLGTRSPAAPSTDLCLSSLHVPQSHLIDDLDRGVDETRDALVSQQSRLKKLIKKSRENWKFFFVIGAPPSCRPRARLSLVPLFRCKPSRCPACTSCGSVSPHRAGRHPIPGLHARLIVPVTNQPKDANTRTDSDR